MEVFIKSGEGSTMQENPHSHDTDRKHVFFKEAWHKTAHLEELPSK